MTAIKQDHDSEDGSQQGETPPAYTESDEPSELPPVYFEQLTQDTALASIKRCSILPHRPAVWLVKRRELALSPLAATVLVKEGIILTKDLELISQSAGMKRDPNDPISGAALATYDTIHDVLLGLVSGPVEASKQMTPMFIRQEEATLQEPASVRFSVRQESKPRAQEDAGSFHDEPYSTETAQPSWKPPQSDSEKSSWEPRVWSEGVPAAPNAAKEIAMSTGKGVGRIVGAGLKAPMTVTHGVTRGFHNLPKMYGGEVREYENVTDLKSGLGVSAKSFGYGITDGLKDFFVQPVVGAKKEGGIGFVKGLGKGLGNIICKPAAGAVGLVSYSFVGVYKEIQALKPKGYDDSEAFKTLGEAEYSKTAEETRREIVRRFCQITMRHNGSV